jgi:hypothetical protein
MSALTHRREGRPAGCMDVSPDPVPSLSVLANLLKCNGPGPCMLKCKEHCLLAEALLPDVPGGLWPVSKLHHPNTAKLT